MALFKKKPNKAKPKPKTFIDGKEKEIVPDTIPDLEVPTPPPDEPEKLIAEDVFAEGRSVGYQEGMIYFINLMQDHLKQYQDELKKNLAQKEVKE